MQPYEKIDFHAWCREYLHNQFSLVHTDLDSCVYGFNFRNDSILKHSTSMVCINNVKVDKLSIFKKVILLYKTMRRLYKKIKV